MKTDKEMILEMFAKDVDIFISNKSGCIVTCSPKHMNKSFENILDAYLFHCNENLASKYFSINGYFKDDHYKFSGYIVKEFDSVDERDDERIFYYGLSEKSIRDIIENGSELDFCNNKL